MKNFLRLSFLILAVSGLTACLGRNGSNKDTTEVDFRYNKGVSLKDWHCYDIDGEKICTPNLWEIKQQSKYLFLSDLNMKDSNTYFVVLKYNKTTSGLTVNKYLKGIYNQLKKDTLEQFTGYTVKQIIFADKQSVYGEYYTSINSKPYMTYSTVFEKAGNLFEIALKVDSSTASSFKYIYKDILFNFRHNNQPVFSGKDEIKNIQVIDLNKL